MMNNPYRITIEFNDMKVSVEIGHSDIKAEEFAQLLMTASRAAGWHDDTLDEIFK